MIEHLHLLSFGDSGLGEELLRGPGVTLALVLSVLIARAKGSRHRTLRWFGQGYTTVFRSLPELLTLLIIYYQFHVGLTAIARLFWPGAQHLAQCLRDRARCLAPRLLPTGQRGHTRGLIQFSTHRGTRKHASLDHGTFVRHGVEEGLIDPERSIQIGIRTLYDSDDPITVLYRDRLHRNGCRRLWTSSVPRWGMGRSI